MSILRQVENSIITLLTLTNEDEDLGEVPIRALIAGMKEDERTDVFVGLVAWARGFGTLLAEDQGMSFAEFLRGLAVDLAATPPE